MSKKIIHINMHIIRDNHKTGARNPVITVKEGKSNRYAHNVQILGPSTVVYSPDKPQPCGARVWIATESDVVLDGGEVKEEPSLCDTSVFGNLNENLELDPKLIAPFPEIPTWERWNEL